MHSVFLITLLSSVTAMLAVQIVGQRMIAGREQAASGQRKWGAR